MTWRHSWPAWCVIHIPSWSPAPTAQGMPLPALHQHPYVGASIAEVLNQQCATAYMSQRLNAAMGLFWRMQRCHNSTAMLPPLLRLVVSVIRLCSRCRKGASEGHSCTTDLRCRPSVWHTLLMCSTASNCEYMWALMDVVLTSSNGMRCWGLQWKRSDLRRGVQHCSNSVVVARNQHWAGVCQRCNGNHVCGVVFHAVNGHVGFVGCRYGIDCIANHAANAYTQFTSWCEVCACDAAAMLLCRIMFSTLQLETHPQLSLQPRLLAAGSCSRAGKAYNSVVAGCCVRIRKHQIR